MRRIGRCLSLALLFSALFVSTLAATPAASFDAARAMAVIRELSSPKYAGRRAGTEGNRRAMDMVARKFKEIGLLPFAETGDYLQAFDASVPETRSVPRLEVYEGKCLVKAYRRFRDFRETYLGRARPGEIEGGAELLSGPYARRRAGTVIVLYAGKSPEDFDEDPLIDTEVGGIILTADATTVSRKGGSVALNRPGEARGFVKLLVTPAVLDELSRFSAAGFAIRMKTDFTLRWVRTANVVGYLPAADGKTDTIEIVSAHLDHLGEDPDGTLYPGAVDNASGTALMLGLAEELAENRGELGKAFVFVAFNAEEEGLFGSWSFVEALPLVPRRAELINIDMVGARDSSALVVYSALMSARDDPEDPIVARPERRLKRLADARGLSIRFERRAYSSDHVPFASIPIPAMTLAQEPAEVYHTRGDGPEAVDEQKLAAAGDFVLAYLREISAPSSLSWPVIVAAFLGLALIGALLWYGLRRRRRLLLPLAAGLLGFGLFVVAVAGPSSGSRALNDRELSGFLARLRSQKSALADPSRRDRVFPSAGNEAAAEYVAGRFAALGLRPYREEPSGAISDYYLESRAEIPRARGEARLALLDSTGAQVREYRRGRDFQATTTGFGSGGSISGGFRFVSTAYDADGRLCPIYCLRTGAYAEKDEARFSERGIKALLIEGNPGAVDPERREYGDGKSLRDLEGSSFLRFVVSKEVMDELEVREKSGFRLHVEWNLDFDWAYPRSVVGYLPGASNSEGNFLVIAAPLDLDPKEAAAGSMSLPFLIAFAETMAAERWRPSLPVLFIAFDGSYEGNLGAKAYLAAPIRFKPPERRSMSGETPNHPFGLVDPYRGEEYDMDRRFSRDSFVIQLADGDAELPSLSLGTGSPSFVLGGEALAVELCREAAARGLELPRVDDPAGGYRLFAQRTGCSALEISLPRSGSDEIAAALAASLAELANAVAVLSPLAPGRLPLTLGEAVLAGLGAALLAALVGGALRRRREARERKRDPYNDFLSRAP